MLTELSGSVLATGAGRKPITELAAMALLPFDNGDGWILAGRFPGATPSPMFCHVVCTMAAPCSKGNVHMQVIFSLSGIIPGA